MPGSRRVKKGQVGKGKNSNVSPTTSWDTESKPDNYDGRANTQSGDAGKEPGGRWSPAYYESAPKVITRQIVRNAGQDK